MHRKGRLDGWKEIARYLNVTVRTAQRKETEGLPVHRKGRTIFAYMQDIDGWLQGHPLDADDHHVTAAAEPSEPPAVKKIRIRTLALVVCGVVLVLLILYFWPGWWRETPAKQFHLELSGRWVKLHDANDQLLWEKEMDGWLITPEAHRKAFEVSIKSPSCVVDLDNDGLMEILVTVGGQDYYMESWRLYCLDQQGDLRWKYSPDEYIRWGDIVTYPRWYLEFATKDLDNDGICEIVVSSRQSNFFPNKITILDVQGQDCGDYYHCGWFQDWLIDDIDGDRIPEILAAGTHNGFDQACLVVLDSRRIDGYSNYRSPPEFRDKTVSPAREKAHLVFPLDPINRLHYHARPQLDRVEKFDRFFQLHMRVTVPPCRVIGILYFFLDHDLRPLHSTAADFYLRLCECARDTGWVDYTFDPADISALGKEILYWDGKEWTTTPTINQPADTP
ncbi:MAG: hypothetical protein JXQ27_14490 [Acidobacteria bacterium]|nr:hypothetical protein [Acidobacteriota bacterium]